MVIRNKSAAVSVKCQGLEEKMQSSSYSRDAEGFSASDHHLGEITAYISIVIGTVGPVCSWM